MVKPSEQSRGRVHEAGRPLLLCASIDRTRRFAAGATCPAAAGGQTDQRRRDQRCPVGAAPPPVDPSPLLRTSSPAHLPTSYSTLTVGLGFSPPRKSMPTARSARDFRPLCARGMMEQGRRRRSLPGEAAGAKQPSGEVCTSSRSAAWGFFVNARGGVAPARGAIWITEQIEAPDGDCQ